MSTIVDLSGKEVDGPDLYTDARERLKKLLERVDAGEVKLEGWVLAYQVTHRVVADRIASSVEDSGLTIAEAVYYLERAKLDLLEATKRP